MSQQPLAGMTPNPISPALRSLRVLMIVESSAGGTGRHVLDLAEGMIGQGHEVHLVHSTVRLDKLFTDRLQAPVLSRMPRMALAMGTSIHPRDLLVARAIRRYARAHGPFDIIHGHSSKGGALARLAALGTSAKAIYTLHGLIMMDPGLTRWKRAFYLGIERLLALRTARIIAVSPEEQRSAIAVGLGEGRTILIPNGVGSPQIASRDEARARIGAAPDAIVAGFVGRLVDQKAPHVLIEAFARAHRAAPRLALAIVGDGPLRQAMRDLGERLGVADHIYWLGERDAREVLAGFDLFAIASRKEGLPYVVLEAMAAAMPIVATDSAGVEILVIDGVNGFVVRRDDVAAFADRLTRLAGDPDVLESCAAASERRACDFTIEAMVDATLRAYHDAWVERDDEAPGVSL